MKTPLIIALKISLAFFITTCILQAFYISSHYFLLKEKTAEIQIVSVADSVTNELSYLYHKQRCIENLMLTEGFRDTIYACPSGHCTIGFGHQTTKPDNFKTGTHYGFAQLYDLLGSDFNGSIALAREFGYAEDNCRQLAVAHAIYCLGVGTVRNIKDFKNDIMKYCFYKKNGINIKSTYIETSRKFEKDLFETIY